MSIGFTENSWTSTTEISHSLLDALAYTLSTEFPPLSIERVESTRSISWADLGSPFAQAGKITVDTFQTDEIVRRYLDLRISSWNTAEATTGYGTRPRPASIYSWALRLSDIALNRDGETPAVTVSALDVARRLAFYSDERARIHRISAAPIISPTDDGRVQVEWNRRGKSVHHVECTIPADADGAMTLLITQESTSGNVLRASEIANASMPEILNAIEVLFSRRIS